MPGRGDAPNRSCTRFRDLRCLPGRSDAGATRLEPTPRPFLKWAGGKSWLATAVCSLLGDSTERYFEPFLGGGAVFFGLRPSRAVLSDINTELISTYRVVRDSADDVIRACTEMEVSKEFFVACRAKVPDDPVRRAARFVYLNRTAFNGLYRVNRQGQFNVPFGCKPGTRPCDADALYAAATALRYARLAVLDYRKSLDHVRPGDLVFLDPPYTVKHNNNGFRRYNERIFTWAEQQDLAGIANDLALRGVRVVVTNAMHADLLALYSGARFVGCSISRASCMAALPEHRKPCQEAILVSTAISRSADELLARIPEGAAERVAPVVLGS